MVPDQIIDEQGESHQTAYPWWWREKNFVENLGGLIVRHPAYCYELGRRYQIVKNSCEIKHYRSLQQILGNHPEKAGKVKFQLMHCFDLETIDSTILVDPCDQKLSKTDLTKFNEKNNGSWVETNIAAWNLECHWKKVAESLKEQFKKQQADLGITSDSQSRKVQEPHWQNLEVWDRWEADKHIEGRWSEGVFGHQRNKNNIICLAARYAKPAKVFCNQLKKL
jgi:hypothetical protein